MISEAPSSASFRKARRKQSKVRTLPRSWKMPSNSGGKRGKRCGLAESRTSDTSEMLKQNRSSRWRKVSNCMQHSILKERNAGFEAIRRARQLLRGAGQLLHRGILLFGGGRSFLRAAGVIFCDARNLFDRGYEPGRALGLFSGQPSYLLYLTDAKLDIVDNIFHRV